jgi:hypothetical protein
MNQINSILTLFIISAPLQINNITFDGVMSALIQLLRLYAERHVTHFASTNSLSRHYFKPLPQSILTTKDFKCFLGTDWLGPTCDIIGCHPIDNPIATNVKRITYAPYFLLI